MEVSIDICDMSDSLKVEVDKAVEKRKVIHYLKKKKWIKKECHGCRLYNQECERGACNLNPYRWKDVEKKKEEYDTS